MKQPNFLVIVADDMGFSDAGCYRGEISTPHLDALAAKGLRYTQHYSTGRCWPSRACILTGNYYQQLPKVVNGEIPDWGRPVPHYLNPLGYRNYHSGKWHVNQFPKPKRHGGFDRSYYVRDYDRNFAVKDHWLDDEPLPPADPESGYYSSTAIADRAVEFLQQHDEEHKGTPFFTYLAFIAPHFPLHAPQTDIDVYRGTYQQGWDHLRDQRSQRLTELGITSCDLSPRQPETKPPWNLSPEELTEEIGPGEAGNAVDWNALTEEQQTFQAQKMEVHAAMIHRMDREIGRVIDQLKAMGEWENTFTVFVSDNGASAEQIIRGDRHLKGSVPGTGESFLCLGPGWSTAANTPFRYHKSWVHEGGVASPLIVHWPDGIAEQGTLRHTPGHFVDLVPTMLELADQQALPDWKGPDTPPFAGLSLAETLNHEGEPDRDFIFFDHIGHHALRIGKWKLVALDGGPWELYDLEVDRSELHDLAHDEPERVQEMAVIWENAYNTYIEQAGVVRPK